MVEPVKVPSVCHKKKPYGGEILIPLHGIKLTVMLEFWEIRSTPLLPSLLSTIWPGVVASDRALSIVQIGLNCQLMLN